MFGIVDAMKLQWIIGALFALLAASASDQTSAGQADFKIALDECGKTFADLVESDESWDLETLCEPKIGDFGAVEFRVSRSTLSLPPTELTESDLLAYSALFARDGFFLQPTSDPKTFKLGAQLKGQEDFTYLIDFYGGIFSYAHFVDDRAIWIRCNEKLGACVYYDNLLHEAPVKDRWGNQSRCSLRWSITFPAPTVDNQITSYMSFHPFVHKGFRCG